MDGNGVIGKREAAKFLRQRRGILAPPRKTESWRDRIIDRRFIRDAYGGPPARIRFWFPMILSGHDSVGLPFWLRLRRARLCASRRLSSPPESSSPLANKSSRDERQSPLSVGERERPSRLSHIRRTRRLAARRAWLPLLWGEGERGLRRFHSAEFCG